MNSGSCRATWDRAILAVIASAGFLIRLLPLRFNLLEGGLFLFNQQDHYYHLRRIAMYAANFPRIPALDYYLSYPKGAECPWPPLYDYIIALLSRLAGSAAPDMRLIEILSALFTPLLAVLCVFPLYR